MHLCSETRVCVLVEEPVLDGDSERVEVLEGELEDVEDEVDVRV